MRILLIEFTDSFLDSTTAAFRRLGLRVVRVPAARVGAVLCRPAATGAARGRGRTGTGELMRRLGVEPDGPVLGALIGAAGAEHSWPELVAELRLDCAWAVAGAAEGTRAAVAALKHGASEYFTLPSEFDDLAGWAAQLRHEGGGAGGEQFGLVGRSPAFAAAVQRLARIVRDGRSSVLILGETGTGKELFARALHTAGPRAAAPFVELNCAAIPHALLESELFGHEAGAFTDARQSKPGLFEAADSGTFFLDEIGDLPLELQAKLLRVLDYRRVRRVGALSETDVDVRLVAATHRDLDHAVMIGRFRQDLLYRLNVIQLELPPLRDRRQDILPLARHFVQRFCEQYGLAVPQIPPHAADALQRYAWPGNVRELRNAVERGLLLGEGHLRAEEMLPPRRTGRDTGGALPFPAPLENIAARAAELMVDRFGGNKSAAAEALGISRKRLYALLRLRAA